MLLKPLLEPPKHNRTQCRHLPYIQDILRGNEKSAAAGGQVGGQTYVDELVGEAVEGEMAPAREAGQQPREAYPHLLAGRDDLHRGGEHGALDR